MSHSGFSNQASAAEPACAFAADAQKRHAAEAAQIAAEMGAHFAWQCPAAKLDLPCMAPPSNIFEDVFAQLSALA